MAALNPLAYGMPSEGLALYMSGSPAFQSDLLQSGWLIGEETLAKKAGMIAAQYQKGRVVLIGFRAQHRAQTHGTFKLLFNALIR